MIDTQHGRVDARLDVQLDAIARMLRDALPVDFATLQHSQQREVADAA